MMTLENMLSILLALEKIRSNKGQLNSSAVAISQFLKSAETFEEQP